MMHGCMVHGVDGNVGCWEDWMMLNEMMEMDVMKDVQFCVMLIFP
jgi:hypothetical protein